MLGAVSSRTMRARAWRGIAEEGAGARTVAQHQEILDALTARDGNWAASAALVHVATTEAWFRQAGERPARTPAHGAVATGSKKTGKAPNTGRATVALKPGRSDDAAQSH